MEDTKEEVKETTTRGLDEEKEDVKEDLPDDLSKLELELTYFDFDGGRAEPIRLAMFMGGIPYKDIRLSKEEFQSQNKQNKFPLKQIPVLTVKGGKPISQSRAILRYVGKLSGLYPLDRETALKCDQVIDTITDIELGIVRATRDKTTEEEKAAARKKWMDDNGKRYIEPIDTMIKISGGQWFTGDGLTICELFVYVNMKTYFYSGLFDGLNKEMLRMSNGVTKFVEEFEALASTKAYYALRREGKTAPVNPSPLPRPRSNQTGLEGHKMKLTYFDVNMGRAQTTRLAWRFNGVKFIDDRIPDASSFLQRKKKGEFPHGSVPILKVGDIHDPKSYIKDPFCQSYAIARYAGKQTGMYPSDPLEALVHDSIIDTLSAFKVECGKGASRGYNEKTYEEQKKNFKRAAPIYMKFFRDQLAENKKKYEGSPYFVGDTMTLCDLDMYIHFKHCFYSNLPFYGGFSPDDLRKDWPEMVEFITHMMMDPRILEWDATRQNNKIYSQKKLKLTYFDFDGGRAEHTRLALTMGGCDFDDIRIDRKRFLKQKADKKFPLGSLPVLEVDGKQFCQSQAVLRTACRMGGFYPKDTMEAAMCDMVMDTVRDLEMGWKNAAPKGASKEDTSAARRNYMKNEADRYLKPMVKWLTDSRGGDFFGGKQPNAADLYMYTEFKTWFTSGMFDGMELAMLDQWPKLATHMNQVHNHPYIKRWYMIRDMKAKQPPKFKYPKLDLHYFDLDGGRGLQIRLALFLAGIEFTDTRFSFEEWPEKKKSGAYPTGTLPVLLVDGEKLSHCKTILRYVGELAGLVPKNHIDALWVDVICDTIADWWDVLHAGGPKDEKPEDRNARFHKDIPRYMEPLQSWLRKHKGKFFMGDTLTIADLHVYAFFRLLFVIKFKPGLEMADLEKFKDIHAWFNYMENEHPGIQHYWQSRKGKEVPPQILRPAVRGLNKVPRKLQVTYFPYDLGRAGYIRLPLYMAGIPFDDVTVNAEGFKKLKEDNKLPLGSLPILKIDNDDKNIVPQSVAIARYAAKLGGFYPKEPLTAAKVDMVIDFALDALDGLYKARKGIDDVEAKKKAAQEYVATKMGTFLGPIEKMLKDNGGEWLVGKEMTLADILMWNALTFNFSTYVDGLKLEDLDEKFPGLAGLVKRVESDKRVVVWRNRNASKELEVIMGVEDNAENEKVKLNLPAVNCVQDLRTAIAASQGADPSLITLISNGDTLSDPTMKLALVGAKVFAVVSTRAEAASVPTAAPEVEETKTDL